MPSRRVLRTLQQARDDVAGIPRAPHALASVPRVRVAIGDPQAPIETFFAILEQQGLLGGQGTLAHDVQLVSMGDHFDWGPPDAATRERAATSGLQLLTWLAAHPQSQVTILVGNHDLSRVSELWHFDDETFAHAQQEADAAYLRQQPQRSERAFAQTYALPTWELAARDLSTFRVAQRTLIERLLRTHRVALAIAPADDLLLTHAGVTERELQALSLPLDAPATAIAHALQQRFEHAIGQWQHGAFAMEALHVPADGESEGRGMLFHRATVAALETDYPRRRFAPASLVKGVVQAIGHVRDGKSRSLLSLPRDEAYDGPLRSLRVGPAGFTYSTGVQPTARHDVAVLLHLDGGMLHARIEDYQLLDLDQRSALRTDR